MEPDAKDEYQGTLAANDEVVLALLAERPPATES
jgi:hypothetical protein